MGEKGDRLGDHCRSQACSRVFMRYVLVLPSGYTLKAEPTRFVVELDMSCETKDVFDIETGRLVMTWEKLAANLV